MKKGTSNVKTPVAKNTKTTKRRTVRSAVNKSAKRVQASTKAVRPATVRGFGIPSVSGSDTHSNSAVVPTAVAKANERATAHVVAKEVASATKLNILDIVAAVVVMVALFASGYLLGRFA